MAREATVIVADADRSAWLDELGPFLAEYLGESLPATLCPIAQDRVVADATTKIRIDDSRGRPAAFLLCSAPASPDLVARGMARARAATGVLGPELGQVVALPAVEGRLDGLSYAVLPYHKPLNERGLGWRVQRTRMSSAVARWLVEATRRTVRPAAGGDVEVGFAHPLRHLSGMRAVSTPVRRAAEESLCRIESTAWCPVHVLMHSDLWKGNILVDDSDFGFVIVDWPGAQLDGYGIYDLLRWTNSMESGDARVRRAVREHCQILRCEPIDARSHLAAALGNLSTQLEFFPVSRFDAMASQCLARLEHLL